MRRDSSSTLRVSSATSWRLGTLIDASAPCTAASRVRPRLRRSRARRARRPARAVPASRAVIRLRRSSRPELAGHLLLGGGEGGDRRSPRLAHHSAGGARVGAARRAERLARVAGGIVLLAGRHLVLLFRCVVFLAFRGAGRPRPRGRPRQPLAKPALDGALGLRDRAAARTPRSRRRSARPPPRARAAASCGPSHSAHAAAGPAAQPDQPREHLAGDAARPLLDPVEDDLGQDHAGDVAGPTSGPRPGRPRRR